MAKALLLLTAAAQCRAAIDRRAVVSRHDVLLSTINASNVLSVGNGAFAVNVDVTSTQSLNASYALYDLNSMSDWGFHTLPFARPDDGKEALQTYNYTSWDAASGRTVRYPTDSKSAQAVWLHGNPHRLSLLQTSLRWLGADNASSPLSAGDVATASQRLDLWGGVVSSNLTLQPPGGGAPLLSASVTTGVHPTLDLVSTGVQSSAPGLTLRLAFSYATGGFGPSPNEWSRVYDALHSTVVTAAGQGPGPGQGWARLTRTLDSDGYALDCTWEGADVGVTWTLARVGPHAFDLLPSGASPLNLALQCLVTPAGKYPAGSWMPWMQEKIAATASAQAAGLPSRLDVLAAISFFWASYWSTGAFVDLSSRTPDPSAFELERRVILSQYLTRVHSAGAAPPQETGLLCNSWSGKHHMEMRFWHTAHWAVWGRPDLLHRADGWFVDYLPNATSTASAQGYKGARWPKMIAAVNNASGLDVPWLGMAYAPFPLNNGSTDGFGDLFAWESASGVGPLLLWQQPHTVWYAEAQRGVAAAALNSSAEAAVLAFHAPLVFATADFLSSVVYLNGSEYWLGPPLYGAEESGDPTLIFNPGWEVVAFKWALTVACEWRARLSLPPVQVWEAVRDGLAGPPLDPKPPGGVPAYGFNAFCPGAYVPSEGGGGAGAVHGPLIPGGTSGASSPCVPCTSHPSPAGLQGVLNGARVGVNTTIANATVSAVLSCWGWGTPTVGTNTWGWDFPLVAIAQSRLSWAPSSVVDMLLMDVLKNSYTAPGLNFQTPGLPAYMPGNGGILLAVAGMAAGFAGPDGTGRVGGGFPPEWAAQAEGFPIPLL